ncbi:hypothetical protein AB0L99_42865 [Streptomyces sp. NPDC051954]|uniref:hypothetical protein n=1 Tax=unclassified Streptomyces TaxID=2593676 RepID=UPI00341E096A
MSRSGWEQLIGNVAEEASARVERALDIGARTSSLVRPCPECSGQLEMYGGAGASPVAHCTKCGHIWTGQHATTAA